MEDGADGRGPGALAQGPRAQGLFRRYQINRVAGMSASPGAGDPAAGGGLPLLHGAMGSR